MLPRLSCKKAKRNYKVNKLNSKKYKKKLLQKNKSKKLIPLYVKMYKVLIMLKAHLKMDIKDFFLE